MAKRQKKASLVDRAREKSRSNQGPVCAVCKLAETKDGKEVLDELHRLVDAKRAGELPKFSMRDAHALLVEEYKFKPTWIQFRHHVYNHIPGGAWCR